MFSLERKGEHPTAPERTTGWRKRDELEVVAADDDSAVVLVGVLVLVLALLVAGADELEDMMGNKTGRAPQESV